MELSVVIPAYNEEMIIEQTLKDYVTFLSDKLKKFEVIVIPNGCSDNTLSIVKNMAQMYPNIKYRNFPELVGKGGAIIEGFKIAEGKLIGFVDADNAIKPDAFYDLVMNIGENGGIIASKWIKEARLLKKQPFLRRITRRIASKSFNLIVRMLFGIKITDTQCGCKLFKHDVIKNITPKLGITNWAFDIDILYLMKKYGYKVIEVPIAWEESGKTHLKLKKTIPEMFLAVVRLRLIYSPFSFVVDIYDKIFVDWLKVTHK